MSPRNVVSRAALYVVLIAFAALMILPFLWMIDTSLKTLGETMTFPPGLLPKSFQWRNYLDASQQIPLFRFMFNSAIVAVGRTVLVLVTSVMAGYGFARFEFPGKSIVFMLLLAVLMIPSQVLVIPQFLLMKHLGWLDTFAALIIPGGFSAFGTFLVRQYLLSQPKEFFESASIDGCTPFGALWRIALPLSVPCIVTLGFISIIAAWNDFLWPLVVTRSESVMVVSLGLTLFQGQYSTNWPLLMSAAVLALIPILVAFILSQKYIVEGVTHTGVKG